MNNASQKRTNEIFRIIDSVIKIEGDSQYQEMLFEDDKKKNKLSYKLDILERVIELVRIQLRYLDNELDFDEFTQGEISAESNSLYYYPPYSYRRRKPGTAPIYLQPKLLIYLLYRHNDVGLRVYNIIEKFINLVWNQLQILDFEKTKTGTIRCFTNTRFAANKLREYGLLKFTKKEAYKTWVLSFTGIMVASKFLKDGEWEKPLSIDQYSTDLHPRIKASFESLEDYDEFIKTLMFVTKPKAKLIEECSIGTKKTHDLFSAYHSILINPDIAKKEKKKRCSNIMKELEKDDDVIRLFKKLSLDFKLGDLKQLK